MFFGTALAAFALDQPVRVESGLVSGMTSEGLSSFKGIPYAAPPLGELRWKAPQPPLAWEGVRDATEFGPPAMQTAEGGRVDLSKMSEDCLNLNIWTPAMSAEERLPVIVDIPGGGFFAGGSSRASTHGARLARRGVVVVSFNYRLGVFGFLAHPALSEEASQHTSGNYGLLDQIAALHWVQKNIAAFGGDAHNVTIHGVSAGGSSVCYLMVCPLAKGLFARGISESAAEVYFPTTYLRQRRYGLDAAEAIGARALGNDLIVLRAMPAGELMVKAQGRTDLMFGEDGTRYWPVVDGWVIPDEPASLFDLGKFSQGPLLIGSNIDEGVTFTIALSIKTAEAWRAFVLRRWRAGAKYVLEQYAARDDAAVHDAASRWVTDWFFAAPSRSVARAVAARGQPVYLYVFSRARLNPLTSIKGALHGGEVPYVFGNLASRPGQPPEFDDVDRALSNAMASAWVQFAKTGNPNNPALPVIWPRYEKSTDQYVEFGDAIRIGSGYLREQLDAFDEAFSVLRSVKD